MADPSKLRTFSQILIVNHDKYKHFVCLYKQDRSRERYITISTSSRFREDLLDNIMYEPHGEMAVTATITVIGFSNFIYGVVSDFLHGSLLEPLFGSCSTHYVCSKSATYPASLTRHCGLSSAWSSACMSLRRKVRKPIRSF